MFHEKVIRIDGGHVNVYLVRNGSKSILIDAGIKGKAQKILDKVRASGCSPEDVALIIVTHTHYDHCGSLAELKSKTGAKILVHESEALNLEQGYTDMPKGTLMYSKVLSAVGNRILPKKWMSYLPVKSDIEIGDRYGLAEYGLEGEVWHMPGHTSGSLCFVYDNDHVFVGDTAFHMRKNSAFPPFADDLQSLFQSWKKLLDGEYAYFYPGHGTPFRRDVLEKTYRKSKKKDR
jgi:glyoxylase-like metal-dependent hydrolase (beta-lactamase superfamily II)